MFTARKAVVLLGPPASGKSSVGDELARRPGIEALRIGHLLRREVARESAVGKEVADALEQGELASTEHVIKVLTAAVVESEGCVLVFDGFPRSKGQIHPFLVLCEAIELELVGVLVLMLGEEEINHRLLGRRVCSKCGAAYHVDYSPPADPDRCDRCGATLARREDDTPELIARRLAGYKELTVPVIEYFERNHPTRTWRVSAEGSPEQTLALITEQMKAGGVI